MNTKAIGRATPLVWAARTGWALLMAWAATGCAVLTAPPALDRASTAPEVLACSDWYKALDAEIDRAGVRDAGAARITGFPHLRVDRYAASLRDTLQLDAAAGAPANVLPHRLSALVQRMQQLDLEARSFEIANLPAQAQARLAGLTASASGAADLLTRTRGCAARLSAFDLATPARTSHLLAHLQVPDDYASSLRIAGLYALTRVPFALGVKRFEAQRRAAFARDAAAPAGGTRQRLVPPAPTSSLTSAQLARMLATPPQDPLGVPAPSAADLELLYAHYAPSFDIAIASSDDQPGALVWQGDAVQVDTSLPVVYRQTALTRHGPASLLQLVYTLWFPARTPAPGSALDLLAGKLDGLVFRVTLAPDGTPLVYDSIHPCGCYHMFFPTPAARPLPAPEPGIEWAFSPQALPAIGLQDRLILRVAAGTHYLERISVEPLGQTSGGARQYTWRDYDSLRSLPSAQSPSAPARRSVFGPDGFIASTDRAERYLFWPMGIARAGAMRQWGRHASAFVGRRHFDDAYLLVQRFAFDSVHFRPPAQ